MDYDRNMFNNYDFAVAFQKMVRLKNLLIGLVFLLVIPISLSYDMNGADAWRGNNASIDSAAWVRHELMEGSGSAPNATTWTTAGGGGTVVLGNGKLTVTDMTGTWGSGGLYYYMADINQRDVTLLISFSSDQTAKQLFDIGYIDAEATPYFGDNAQLESGGDDTAIFSKYNNALEDTLIATGWADGEVCNMTHYLNATAGWVYKVCCPTQGCVFSYDETSSSSTKLAHLYIKDYDVATMSIYDVRIHTGTPDNYPQVSAPPPPPSTTPPGIFKVSDVSGSMTNKTDDTTPTINATTNKTADCGLGVDNESWTAFTTTGGEEHVGTLPAADAFNIGEKKIIYINCTDADSNSGYSLISYNITDGIAPIIDISNPPEGLLCTAGVNNTILFNWSANENHDVIFTTYLDINTTNYYTNTSYTNNTDALISLEIGFGSWIANFTAVDNQSNSASSYINFSVSNDTTNPVVVIDYPKEGMVFKNRFNSTIIFNWTAYDIYDSQFTVYGYINSSPSYYNTSFNNNTVGRFQETIGFGNYFVNVTAIDAHCNRFQHIINFSVFNDTTKPKSFFNVSSIGTYRTSANKTNVSLKFNATDNLDTTFTIIIYINGTPIYTNASYINGTNHQAIYSFNQGVWQLNLTAADTENNLNWTTWDILINRSAIDSEVMFNPDCYNYSSLGDCFSPDWSLAWNQINWSDNVTIRSGNFTWNFTEYNVSVIGDSLLNFTNKGYDALTYSIALNGTDTTRWQLFYNQTNITSVTPVAIIDVDALSTKYINLTMSVFNLTEKYANWSLVRSTADWSFNITITTDYA